MKKYLIIFSAVALIAIGALFVLIASKNSASPEQKTANASSVNENPVVTALAESNANKAVIIDVRTPEEFATGHAKNATNFDLNLLNAGQLPEMAKDSKIYVYCRSGNRSNQAKIILTKNGFTNVTDLGGLDKMKAGGAF